MPVSILGLFFALTGLAAHFCAKDRQIYFTTDDDASNAGDSNAAITVSVDSVTFGSTFVTTGSSEGPIIDEKFLRAFFLSVPRLEHFQDICETFSVGLFVRDMRIGFEELLETLKGHGQTFVDLLNHLIPYGFHLSRLEQDTLKALGWPIRPALVRSLSLDEFYHVLMLWNNERVPATQEYIQAVLRNLHFCTMLTIGEQNLRETLLKNYAKLIQRVDDQDGNWASAIDDIITNQL